MVNFYRIASNGELVDLRTTISVLKLAIRVRFLAGNFIERPNL